MLITCYLQSVMTDDRRSAHLHATRRDKLMCAGCRWTCRRPGRRPPPSRSGWGRCRPPNRRTMYMFRPGQLEVVQAAKQGDLLQTSVEAAALKEQLGAVEAAD